MTVLRTERLLLRPWQEKDKAGFQTLNADTRVMEFFPAPLSAAESDALADEMAKRMARRGYGFWAVEHRDSGAFMGFTGLNDVHPELPFAPALEVGWRFAHEFWGQGYAHEAAKAALAFGFEVLGPAQIVAFTAVQNERSQRLMQRLGMVRDAAGDFDHPELAADCAVRRHALFRARRPA